MEIKKHLMKILFVLIIAVEIMQTTVFASILTIKITTDKEKYEFDDKVTVTVDWTEKMQAASFSIKYDADKLKLDSADINDVYYNTTTTGEISVDWVSLEGKDLTEINFVFKCIKSGEANIEIKEARAFANGDMVIPSSYDITTSGSKNITINETKEQVNQQDKTDKKEDESTKDETIIKSELPKAGKDAMILFMILSVSIVGAVALKKAKGLSDI